MIWVCISLIIMILVCISLMISDVKHFFFISLLIIYTSFLEKCLRYLHIKKIFFVVFVIELYELLIYYQIGGLQIFSSI